MSNEMTLLPAALRLAKKRGMRLPDDLQWGLRSIAPDFTSSRGYRWPFPGQWARCKASEIYWDNTGGCPRDVGDGICIGLSWRGMASGGMPATTILLVGYRETDVLGRDGGWVGSSKIRVARAYVADIQVPLALLQERTVDEALNLRDADLGGANLYAANLYAADLRGANLRGADLRGANLGDANLRGANLGGADLGGADLGGADLYAANLYAANLGGANLGGANLGGADLGGANLYAANLGGADLRGANLKGCWNVDEAIGLTDEQRKAAKA